MSWSSGIFSRIHNWVNDANASIGIVASRHDEEADNFATGINESLHKGGQNTPTADIGWGGYKLTNLGAATTAAGAARLDQAQMQTSAYAVATGGANTYAVALSPAASSYVAGMMIRFRPSANCTGAATVNVNGLGAKSIKLLDGSDPYRNALHTSSIAECVYDGTNFVLLTPARPFSGAIVGANTISIPNATVTTITEFGPQYDTDGYHNTSSNKERLTVPDGVTRVRLLARADFDINATGYRHVTIRSANGTVVGTLPDEYRNAVNGTWTRMMAQTPVLTVTPGTYFYVQITQTSGAALDMSFAQFSIEAVY